MPIIPISQANTIIYKWTMMIEICNASVTNSAMFSSKWSKAPTTVTQSRQQHISFLPFVEIWYLKRYKKQVTRYCYIYHNLFMCIPVLSLYNRYHCFVVRSRDLFDLPQSTKST